MSLIYVFINFNEDIYLIVTKYEILLNIKIIILFLYYQIFLIIENIIFLINIAFVYKMLHFYNFIQSTHMFSIFKTLSPVSIKTTQLKSAFVICTKRIVSFHINSARAIRIKIQIIGSCIILIS